MDELLVRILTRLLRVHDELGPATYEEAARRALVAIAAAVHSEAERKAGGAGILPPAPRVVPFPLARRRAKEDAER
mgnify:CR=1 FL=1